MLQLHVIRHYLRVYSMWLSSKNYGQAMGAVAGRDPRKLFLWTKKLFAAQRAIEARIAVLYAAAAELATWPPAPGVPPRDYTANQNSPSPLPFPRPPPLPGPPLGRYPDTSLLLVGVCPLCAARIPSGAAARFALLDLHLQTHEAGALQCAAQAIFAAADATPDTPISDAVAALTAWCSLYPSNLRVAAPGHSSEPCGRSVPLAEMCPLSEAPRVLIRCVRDKVTPCFFFKCTLCCCGFPTADEAGLHFLRFHPTLMPPEVNQ
jgi:hypothetical protein